MSEADSAAAAAATAAGGGGGHKEKSAKSEKKEKKKEKKEKKKEKKDKKKDRKDKDEPFFSIIDVKLVTSWQYEQKKCQICHNDLDGPSIDMKIRGKEHDSSNPGLRIEWGTCGHGFHQSCIMDWSTTHATCPKCNATWEKSRVETISRFDTSSASGGGGAPP